MSLGLGRDADKRQATGQIYTSRWCHWQNQICERLIATFQYKLVPTFYLNSLHTYQDLQAHRFYDLA
jgi:hypothetical protein